jgi:hypothetical protein
MDDPMAMGLVERIRDLDGVAQCAIERQRTLLESGRERLALQVLHDEELDAVLVPNIVKYADVGMIERADGPRFPLEPLLEFRVSRQLRREHLDRDCPRESSVAGLVDLAHATRTEKRFDLVRT